MEYEQAFPETRDRHAFVADYLASFDERDLRCAEQIARAIEKPATPLASTLVLIPVAAHQESGNIERSLRLYAEQATEQPFSVILSLNAPANEQNNPHITASIEAVAHAQCHYPQLDVRSALTFYDDPTIGVIRRDLWNGALLQASREGAYAPTSQSEYLGISHDIDTISMSPRYIKRIQAYYAARQRRHDESHLPPLPHSPRSTLVKHAPSPGHPNISRGIYWLDFTSRYSGVAYEEGLVLPLSHYAKQGGFSPSSRTHETAQLWNISTYGHYINGTTMETSPRRLVERLRDGYHTIWAPNTFGADDTCRNGATHDDITLGALETIIEQKEFLPTLGAMAHHAIDMALRKAGSPLASIDNDPELTAFVEANVAMNRRFLLAAEVLNRVVDTPRLASKVLDAMDDETVVSPILASYFDVTLE